MNSDFEFEKSIVLISGSDPNNFGTGFVIFNNHQEAFVLTCTHVINEIGKENIRVQEYPAELIAFDDETGFDIAILKVNTSIPNPALPSKIDVQANCEINIPGFYLQGKQKKLKNLKGNLGGQAKILSFDKGRATSWDIKLNNGENLEKGYSGSPLLDTQNTVIGIVNLKIGNQVGQAISLDAISLFWEDANKYISYQKNVIKRIEHNRPLMNFQKEVELFYRIMNQEDKNTRLIFLQGSSKMGKSRILEEYQDIAQQYGFATWKFDLKQPKKIEVYLDELVQKIGISYFPKYEEFLDARPLSMTLDQELDWLKTLTRKFFRDLRDIKGGRRLFVFFDHFDVDRPDLRFKDWFINIFIGNHFAETLLFIVVAGQDDLKLNPNWTDFQKFQISGVHFSDYWNYASQFNIELPKDQINLLHEALKGSPGMFASFIEGRINK